MLCPRALQRRIARRAHTIGLSSVPLTGPRGRHCTAATKSGTADFPNSFACRRVRYREEQEKKRDERVVAIAPKSARRGRPIKRPENQLGGAILARLEVLALSPADLAERLGVSRTTVWRLMHGKTAIAMRI